MKAKTKTTKANNTKKVKATKPAKTTKVKATKATKEKVKKVEPTEKVCNTCGETKPIAEFRLHKNGYRLNKCYECEKKAWKKRSKKQATVEATSTKKTKATKEQNVEVISAISTMFPVTTKSGKTFNVSSVPIRGGRKIESTETDKILYTTPEITRDEARAIFQAFANVPRTGISASIVV